MSDRRHGNGRRQPERAILYARVSTDEQVRSGYSLEQQMEALRAYAAGEGYEVLEEIADPGQSGASLERPGMDRVRDLVDGGGVSAVLAQDRDRFAREPAYHYLLKRELEDRGCKLRALNDRGDDTPEGELTDGILDQLAKFERAKMAERTRRGKLQKARSGKIVNAKRTRYGFRANASGLGYEVDEEKMVIVRRIFHLIGVEKVGVHGVITAFKREGIPTPTGKRIWERAIVKRMVWEDSYRPHSYDELKEILPPQVLAAVNPTKTYGVYYFNRERVSTRSVAEDTPAGRVYKKKSKRTIKDKSEWIGIPVPDAGIPRSVIEAARQRLEGNKPSSRADDRFWELSGGIFRCGCCGRSMAAHASYSKKGGKKVRYHYYRCQYATTHKELCSYRRTYRADALEGRVWEEVSAFLKEPARLETGLEKMIRQKAEESSGCDPAEEAKRWLERISALDNKRKRYQEMAAEGLIDFAELKEHLQELEDERSIAEGEVDSLLKRGKQLEEMRRNKDALLDSLKEVTPRQIDGLSQTERRRIYQMVGLRATTGEDGTVEVEGDLAGLCFGVVRPIRPSPSLPTRDRRR